MTPYLFAGLGIFDRRRFIKYRNSSEIDRIIDIISNHYGLNDGALLRKTRNREIVFPRQIAMYLIRTKLKLTLKEIAKHFGKDHSTVIYSIDTITGLITNDKKIRENVEYIEYLYDHKFK